MQKISPCLWFDNQAEEAAEFYVSIFNNSRIEDVARYGDEGAKASGLPSGSVMLVKFFLDGQEFLAMNAGPHFPFTPAISFTVNCETQEEIDRLWDKLCEGGVPEQCGWLKDKYGLSWQIVPTILGELIQDKDLKKVERVMHALYETVKIDISKLQQAYDQD